MANTGLPGRVDAAARCKLSVPMDYAIEIAPDRSCVWIHASDGSTVGRFGRFGVDLHTTMTEQLAGASQCRLCTHGAVTVEDWALFRERAREWWGVDVPADAFDVGLFGKTLGGWR
jgi:hypothetical protein